jgi:hypothetical protein
MDTFLISIHGVSTSTHSTYGQFSSTTLLIGAQYGKDMYSYPIPLDE